MGRATSISARWVGALALVAITLGATNCGAAVMNRVPPGVVEAARQSGRVRVIVQLVQPAGITIAAAQDAVLAELAGTAHRVLQRYLTSPALALEAGEDALLVLDRSAHVRSVAGDFELRPTSPGPRL